MTPASPFEWRMYLMVFPVSSTLTFFWEGIAPESDPFNITLTILPLGKTFRSNFSCRNVGAPSTIVFGPWYCAQTYERNSRRRDAILQPFI